MDCKIAGTEKGITGFQLDLKLRGISHELMAETVERARVARLFVLGEMAKTLAEPRKELSKYAPRIVTVKINPEKIGALIGPGGKKHQAPGRRIRLRNQHRGRRNREYLFCFGGGHEDCARRD